MMQNSQQQAYDRGITIFSPDGRLYQVEYAREAVKRGTAAVGVRTPEGVVLAADGRLRSSLQVAESVEKIHKADEHLGIATAGHAADARQLVDLSRRRAQVERLRYGEAVDVETLTKAITDNIQEFTQTGGARPFGCALLIGGVDEDGSPRLFETDPSGTPYEWKAVAVGGNQREAQDELEANYPEVETVDDGLQLAFDALAATADGGLTPEGMSAATIPVETGSFETLERSEIADHLDENGLLDEE
ncbi:proteasome endopeptidase complex, archaeal, alpha subunit [Haloglomus irregulare]|uniref:Proteasome subunit alpha n=1 Tax=Haloglomus irregulare TaxID=2234134 RepID=A0A554NFK9_9EURY|nr:archaeal proteasome endopeptidase complex subunit alpha [Haloglomus irregulare]TSD15800.1 proteasome endopeptidase complex, archaeal, alpha subunit [Haloglomus irregulare]